MGILLAWLLAGLAGQTWRLRKGGTSCPRGRVPALPEDTLPQVQGQASATPVFLSLCCLAPGLVPRCTWGSERASYLLTQEALQTELPGVSGMLLSCWWAR